MRRLAAAFVVLACCGGQPAGGGAGLVFEKHVLDASYRAEGVAIADLNGDGTPDLATDQFWYEGPAMTPHAIRMPQTYDPATAYADGFGIYPLDVDGDGWLDLVVAPHPGDAMFWYANPRGTDALWAAHLLAATGVAGLETPVVADLFADGRPVLVMTDSAQGLLAWLDPPADPTLPWIEHAIATSYAGAPIFTHGAGVGDIDGDGMADVITAYGWFQQTADRATWVEHPFAFGPNPSACSQMFAFDVDGDGFADVLCARPHDYGLHWWQQVRSGAADPTFVDHVVDDTTSQMHALRLDDLDGDGVPELVSGKRWWAHGPSGDPGATDPAVLSYYVLGRGAGSASFARVDIDVDSGIGTQFAIGDIDGDARPDIAVSNKKGLFTFLRR